MTDPVRYEVTDGVATLTLDRPDRLNAQNIELFECALGLLETAAADDGVRVVVVTGAGRAFCAGGDISTMGAGAQAGGGVAGGARHRAVRDLRVLTHTSQLLHEMPKVTIAAINGAVAGGGLSWATACDLRYAAASARFATAFVNVGLSGDFGISWFLSRVVGPAKARELLLFSDPLDATEAERIGLVSAVFPDDRLLPEVRDRAARLAAKAPIALARIKENLSDAQNLPLGPYLDAESDRLIQTMRTADHAEAAAAFLEKRAPDFRGR
jgi:2-(1,2-epoxy-1,2-dihydrophenyl)acetyl-CoA isomerase